MSQLQLYQNRETSEMGKEHWHRIDQAGPTLVRLAEGGVDLS